MAKGKQKRQNRLRTRVFDESWKIVLEKYFWQCLDFYFPEISRQIAKEKGYTFLDQELQQISPKAHSKKRRLDKLARVYLLDDTEIWVLLHIEVQTYKEEEFAMRMYSYHYRIWDKYQKQVASVAILADNHATFRPQTFELKAFGKEFVRFRFETTKLLEWQGKEKYLEAEKNIFGIVTLASLKAYEENFKTRAQWKYLLTKMLYDRGYGEEDVMNLYRFLDGIMVLPEKMEIEYNDKVVLLEEEKKMPYITTAERIGIRKGKIEGIKEGKIEGIELVLEIKFGAAGLSLIDEIRKISDIEKLTKLQEKVKKAKDIEEVRQSLQNL